MPLFQTLLTHVRSYTRNTLTEDTQNVFDILKPGDIAIDCGANVGNITAKMAKTGVKVYAFEPNPHAYAALTKRFAKNPAVHCMNKAVWDHTGILKLYFHKNSSSDPIKWSSGSSLVAAKTNIEPDQYVEVEVIDLTQFITDLGKPIKLLKLDVEGVECDILNKLIDEGLVQSISSIVAETHEARIPHLASSVEALQEKIITHNLSNINLNWI